MGLAAALLGDRVTQFDAGTQQVFALAVARVLRDSRRQQQLTQDEVAARTNGLVTESALAHFESARRHLPVEVLWVLAAALGMEMSALVGLAQHAMIGRSPEVDAVASQSADSAN